MASRRSAGIVLYRIRDDAPQVLIGHMGGPFWARKDERAWSIPKGEYKEDEDPFEVARREFEEELGSPVPSDAFVELGTFRQPSGKVIAVWAAEGDLDAGACVSNTFAMEWPRGSGRIIEVPELDRAAWFGIDEARSKLVRGQVPVVDELRRRLDGRDAVGGDSAPPQGQA